MMIEELQDHIISSLRSSLINSTVSLGELSLRIELDCLEETVQFLREDTDCWFRQLVDVCGVDYLQRSPRFDVVYHFLSLTHNHRVRLIVGVEEQTLIPSLGSFFRSAGWFEREIFDMYGLSFKHHVDLRRLLTDYTFEGHPLRKDFPLVGTTEVHYCEEQERVMERPVHLEQPLRDYRHESSWQGIKALFPSQKRETT